MSALQFHLREVRADLHTLRQQLRALPDPPTPTWTLRDVLSSALVALEHTTTHHLASAQALMGAPPEAIDMEHEIAPVGGLQPGLVRLKQSIDDLLDAVDPGAEPLLAQPIAQAALARLTGTIGGKILPELRGTLSLVIALQRAVNPEESLQELQELQQTDPERECLHPRARELTECPRCHEPLGRMDRTFTGSFCEGCGTRWEVEQQDG